MKRKALALLISLVLLRDAVMPGTLAVSHDTTETQTFFSQQCEQCSGIGTHNPGCPNYVSPVNPGGALDNSETDETQEYSQICPNCGQIGPHNCPGEQVGGDGDQHCSCNVGRQEHLLCCPLHVKDEPGTLCPECRQNAGHLESCEIGRHIASTAACTCNVAGQQHAAGCALCVGTPAFCGECGLGAGHLAECSHYGQSVLLRRNENGMPDNVGALSQQELYRLLMQTESMAAYNALLDALTEEAREVFFESLTGAEREALEEHTAQINVISTVNFTVAGHFRNPVQVGLAHAKRRMDEGMAEPLLRDTEGLESSKLCLEDENGKYLRLESYVTGRTTVTTANTAIPVDVVLVLDQSGSMGDDFSGNATSDTTKRRQYAMKQAVNNFIEEVRRKTASDGVDHRMALVTFASNAETLQHWITVDDNGAAVLGGKINGLPDNPEGATNIGAGMERAESLTIGGDYSYSGVNTIRQKVVIVFTDGVPTKGSDFNVDVANAALAAASRMKSHKDKVTVYSIGIFTGANPGQVSGAPNNSEEVGAEWEIRFGGLHGMEEESAAGNRFLNFLCCNCYTADQIGLKIEDSGYLFQYRKYRISQKYEWFPGNNYYLTAGNAAALNEIFRSISQQIQTGQAAIELGSNTVVKDVISEYFQLPPEASGRNIIVKTARYNSNGTFGADEPSDLTATVSEDGRTITVAGFNFSQNYCDTQNGRVEGDNSLSGDFYGRKLIIEIPIEARTGFLGGNAVPTNGPASGVYRDADILLESFEIPGTDVPIPQMTITAADKNVYLLGDPLEQSQLIKGAMVGNEEGSRIDLDPEATNYGLESWQNAYVTIHGSANGADSGGLTADSSYTIECGITPNSTGNITAQTYTGTGSIRVFKPQISFMDKIVWIGDSVTQNTLRGQQTGQTAWCHPDVAAENPEILGTEPEITLSGTLPAGSLDENGKVQVTTDIPVNMSAKIDERDIGEYVIYDWSEAGCSCAQGTIGEHSGADDTKHEFKLHVKSGTLTIKKSGGRAGEGFVFHVANNDGISMRVSCEANSSVTIARLPAGTYTVIEELGTGGAWRYNANVGMDEITETDLNAAVTIENTQSAAYLLDGWAFAVNNSVQQLSGQ